MMKWQSRLLSDFLIERKERIKHVHANQLGLQRIKKIDFSGNLHLAAATETKTDMIRVKPGDLVISGINAAKGAIAIYEGKEDVLATIHYSAYQSHSDRVSIEFLKWFFKSAKFADLLNKQVPGGIKTEIKPKHILPLRMKFPTLSNQIKIANGLNRFLLHQSKLDCEIVYQETLLIKLKQTILREATQGKLTADWRKENPDVEPASQLWERIEKEKQRLIAEKKIRKAKPLPPITPEEIPFEIPDNWEWCRLETLIEEKPRNGLSLKPVEYRTDTKTLKLSATSSGTFDGSQCKYLDIKVDPDSYLWLRDGDILIQRANSLELVGTTAVYRGRDFEFIYPDLMMKCRTVFWESTDYLYHVLSSQTTKNYFQSKASGSAGNMPKVSQTTVIATLIPLPPLGEQIAITKRVAALLDLCRQLETEIKHSRTHAESLLQAVLKEAFTSA